MSEFDFYPPKPELIEEKKTQSWKNSLISILIFMGAMSVLFFQEFWLILALVIVILIHELGHFLMMKWFKYENLSLMFVPLMGAFVQGKKEVYKQKESILVLLAGPIPGIFLGTFLAYYGVSHQIHGLGEVGLMFIFVNMLNLVPIDPLDGGQLFKSLIKARHEYFQFVFSLVSSLILILIGFYLQQYIILIFGFFLGFRVRSMQKNYHIHRTLKRENINYITNYNALSNRDFHLIKQVLMDTSPTLKMYLNELPEEDTNSLLVNQVNNVLVTPFEKDAGLLFKILTFIFWISGFVIPLFVLATLDFKSYFHV